MSGKSLGFALRVDIAATPDRVWRALTSPPSLERWLSRGARISAREGGLLRGSFDRGVTGFSAHIDRFESGRRLRLVYLPDESLILDDAAAPIDDVLLEAAPKQTIVRVLGNGYATSTMSEPVLMRHHAGWRAALARLKVFLEKGLDESAATDGTK